MGKMDLTSLEWCELVFSERNKEYGAYRMRKEAPKRYNWAIASVLAVALMTFSLPYIQPVRPKQKEVVTEVTVFSELEEAEERNEAIVRPVEPSTAPPVALKSSIKFTAPVIKKDEEVHEEDEMKSQEEVTHVQAAISIADVKGNDEANGQDIADLKEAVTQAVPIEEEKTYTIVEQMPQFPGGDAELLAFVAKNLHYPQFAQDNGIEGKVYIRFVVSKEGDVEDVTVLRPLDPSCDKEAVRVIRLLPKWIPGRQNGTNVPVFFTLPITFRLQ